MPAVSRELLRCRKRAPNACVIAGDKVAWSFFIQPIVQLCLVAARAWVSCSSGEAFNSPSMNQRFLSARHKVSDRLL
jgi:hypothetical protein